MNGSGRWTDGLSDDTRQKLESRLQRCAATGAIYTSIHHGADPLEAMARLAIALGEQRDKLMGYEIEACVNHAVPILIMGDPEPSETIKAHMLEILKTAKPCSVPIHDPFNPTD